MIYTDIRKSHTRSNFTEAHLTSTPY